MVTEPSARAILKRLRAVPALSRPATRTVRFVADRLGVTPEFAIKHLPRSGLTVTTSPGPGAGPLGLDYAFYHLTDRGAERRDKITPHGHWLNYLFTRRGIPQ